ATDLWARQPHVQKLKLFSDKSIASEFGAVVRTAHALLADLKTMEESKRAENALGIAGQSFRAAAMISRTGQRRRLTIKHFINQLELLVEVAEDAAKDIARLAEHARSAKRARSAKGSAAGRPGGTPGNVGFDLFVQQLLWDAQRLGGKLTIYKSESADG